MGPERLFGGSPHDLVPTICSRIDCPSQGGIVGQVARIDACFFGCARCLRKGPECCSVHFGDACDVLKVAEFDQISILNTTRNPDILMLVGKVFMWLRESHSRETLGKE